MELFNIALVLNGTVTERLRPRYTDPAVADLNYPAVAGTGIAQAAPATMKWFLTQYAILLSVAWCADTGLYSPAYATFANIANVAVSRQPYMRVSSYNSLLYDLHEHVHCSTAESCGTCKVSNSVATQIPSNEQRSPRLAAAELGISDSACVCR